MRYLKNCWYQAGWSEELGFDAPVGLEHLCVGLPLARMEMRAILESPAKRVKRFHILNIERRPNNTPRGIERLEVTAHRA